MYYTSNHTLHLLFNVHKTGNYICRSNVGENRHLQVGSRHKILQVSILLLSIVSYVQLAAGRSRVRLLLAFGAITIVNSALKWRNDVAWRCK